MVTWIWVNEITVTEPELISWKSKYITSTFCYTGRFISHLSENSGDEIRFQGLGSYILARRPSWLQIFFSKYELFLSLVCSRPMEKIVSILKDKIEAIPQYRLLRHRKISLEQPPEDKTIYKIRCFVLLLNYCFSVLILVRRQGKK